MCETAREAISALLDDEDPGVDRSALEEHLQSCSGCGEWRAGAHEVTRNARLEPARASAVSSDELVGLVLAQSRPPRRPGSVTLVRLGLILVAVAQAWVTLPILIKGHDHTAPEHIAHEVGAFAMALAIGFVFAAWKPDRAKGMQALVGAVAVLLMITAFVDLLHGRTDIGDEAPHLFAVAGWLLLVYLAAASPSTTVDPSWSLAPVVRAFTGRRTVTGAAALTRTPAQVQKRAPAEPGRRRAG
jgi:predicted anti-sigma-YlaC factor YlaD